MTVTAALRGVTGRGLARRYAIRAVEIQHLRIRCFMGNHGNSWAWTFPKCMKSGAACEHDNGKQRLQGRRCPQIATQLELSCVRICVLCIILGKASPIPQPGMCPRPTWQVALAHPQMVRGLDEMVYGVGDRWAAQSSLAGGALKAVHRE